MKNWNDLTAAAEQAHGIVTTAQLLAAGTTERQLGTLVEGGRLVRVGYGTFRIGGAPPSFEGQALAAVLEFAGFTWASHHTAARLHDLRLWGDPNEIEVTRPTGLSTKRSIATVHRSTMIPASHQTVVAGVPCLTVPRTLFDLARTTGPKVLLRGIDRGLLLRTCTMGSLWQVFYELGGRGRPGTRRMREVLEPLGRDHVPPESELEAVGMALLAGLGIEWQVEMTDEQGYLRRVDGLHRAGRVVVEFDGEQHRREPQRSLDLDGDRRLGRLGYSVVRLDWHAVTEGGEETLDRIRSAVIGAAA